MLAPAKDYKNQKKKIPIRIECRHEETHQLIGDTYEMSHLKEIYKQSINNHDTSVIVCKKMK